MSFYQRLSQGFGPVRLAVGYAVADAAVYGIAAVLALVGFGFLCAAAFVILQRHVGLEAALTVFGLIFLVLAALVRLMRPVRPTPPPAPAPDPATQLLFDLGVSLGRALTGRRR